MPDETLSLSRQDDVAYRDFTPGYAWHAWSGRRVSDVLDASAIARVWLIEAHTTAPSSLDARNIVEMLAGGDVFEPPEAYWRVSGTQDVWVALVEMADGSMFSVRIRDGWVALGQDGQVGVFRVTNW